MRGAFIAARDGGRSTLTALQIGMTANARRRGGVDRYYFNLVRELWRWDVRVHGLVLGEPADLADDRCDGVECCANDDISMLRRWSAFRSAVSRGVGESDLVAAHFAPYVFPALDRLGGRPLVVHFHGPWAFESAAHGGRSLTVAIKRLLERFVYRTGARFIVLSEAFAKILEQEYGVARAAIRVVPGGVDLDRFNLDCSQQAARRSLGWDEDRPTVVTVRRLVASKGIEQLIDAAPTVAREVPEVQIVVVGDGPSAALLRRRAEQLGVERTVRFAGYVGEHALANVYRAADLLCVPSVAFEGFGLIVLEALASGTPALVTPVGGLPEVVRPLEPALVLAGTAPRDLAAGITAALAGRVRMPPADECRRYAERFGWSDIARRVGDVYREVA